MLVSCSTEVITILDFVMIAFWWRRFFNIDASHAPRISRVGNPPRWNVYPVANIKPDNMPNLDLSSHSFRNAQNNLFCQPHCGSAMASRKGSEQDHPACPSHLYTLHRRSQRPRPLDLPPQHAKQIPFSRHHSPNRYELVLTPQTGHRASHGPSRIPKFRRAILRSSKHRLRSDVAALHGPIRHGQL